MIIIGVTGNFGSGKSTVAKMFQKRGAWVIDADAVVHELLESDIRCRRAILKAFGRKVMIGGEVDRPKLAKVVFSDPRHLRRLESILHPFVKARVRAEIKRSRVGMVVLDVPLLIEAGWVKMVDSVIVVNSTVEKEVTRLKKRSGLARRDVVKRLKFQLPFREKRKFADHIVDNRGSLGDTDKQVQKIYETLIKKNH